MPHKVLTIQSTVGIYSEWLQNVRSSRTKSFDTFQKKKKNLTFKGKAPHPVSGMTF